MEELNNLISKLSKQEISLVRSYLEHLNLKDRGGKILLVFFDFLLKNNKKDPDADACARYLYGKNADGKFRMLKSKLRSRLLDALVMDKSIIANKVFDTVSSSSLQTRKRVLNLNYLFFSKGSIPMTIGLIDEILSKGKKYENYSSMLEALKIQKYVKGYSNGIKEFNEINKKIAFIEYCEQAKTRAADNYYKLITRTDFSAALKPDVLKLYLEEAILELKKDLKYTNSGLVAYYLKMLEVTYFKVMDDHAASRNCCLELLAVIKENPSVYKKLRIGIAYDSIGECDIHLNEYEKAISNFKAAQKIFAYHSKNYLRSKELELLAFFYSKNIPLAEKALKEIIQHADVNLVGDFRQSKHSFYQANILFGKEKYKEALKEIHQHLAISKDRTGWEIGVRILAIMCNIELKNDDQAASMTENLAQHVKRIRRDGLEISERNSMIVTILHDLAQNGFMFNTLTNKTMSAFVAIAGNDPEKNGTSKKLTWEPLGPELIKFHEWMRGKLKIKKELAKGNLQFAKK